jgi:Zn-finger nucleic acid-binding protein
MIDETHPVRYCRNCRGVLIERRSFASVVEKRRAWAHSTPAPPIPLDRAELERQVRCPACAGPMMTHPYYGPGNVVIDGCQACELVWLDCGELKQIVDAPGRDRGAREVPRRVVDDPAGNPITGARMVGSGRSVDSPDLFDLLSRLF